MFINSVWSILPPIIAIVLSLIIKEPICSLFIANLIGAFLIADLRPAKAIDALITDGLLQSISDNAGIVTFVVILGIIILILNITGGSEAFGKWISKYIKTKTGAMLFTFLFGIVIFIDDMFNCFTVGAIMRPVTDRYKISRQKLAYILDATAAPICMIAPISSWGAAVSSTAEGIGISGIKLFIEAIPYNFYSLLTLVFILAIGIMNFDYASMKKYELESEKSEFSFKKEENVKNSKGKICDLVIPVAAMIICCIFSMLYVGGFFDINSESFHNIGNAFANTDGSVAFPWGGIIALIFTFVYVLLRKTITFKEATDCIPKSFTTMSGPIIILILAVSLKNMITILGVNTFIGSLMQNAAANLYNMLPAVIFLVGCLLAFASGTSWGTFGILIPIVTAIFPKDSSLLIIGISACLAGAVCGDHCSPISDTTIMSSAAAGCEHISHVSTQLPYAVTVAAISFVTYIIAGIVQNALICLLTGSLITVGTLAVIKKVSKTA